jgi:RNA polymerase sigma-70 factor (ECF subfamily)
MEALTAELLAAREGDRIALHAALRLAHPDLWRYAAAIAGPELADDIAQDALIRIWRALPAYRAECPGRPWILAIGRRAIADAQRHRARWTRLLDRLAHDRTLARLPVHDHADAHRIHAMIDELPAPMRDAFVLTALIGCSYEEAATACGVAIGTIRSRVARARDQLATEIQILTA